MTKLRWMLTAAALGTLAGCSGKAPAPPAQGGPTVQAPPSSITDVHGDLASVNLGQVDGLKRGDRLVITRADEFVGFLRLELVRQHEAAGRIVHAGPAPKRGDHVEKAPPEVSQPTQLHGRLIATVTAARDGLASINAGQGQGIEEGMRLMIVRGDQYIATLRIDRVDPGESGGLVIDQQYPPMQGDKVLEMSGGRTGPR